MIIEELTMPAFKEGLTKTRTIIVPFGVVEEHGRHLPLGTDTIHAYELSRETSRHRPLFVAPPVWYGLCRSTSQHPGTITISGDTLRKLTVELVTSFYNQGLRNFVLLSGHAGGTHMAAITDAGETILASLKESRVAVLSILDLIAGIPDGIVETENDSHAGEVETSLMLHLRPEHIDGTSPEEYPCFPTPILARDKKRFWPGGVWGDPSKASVEKGKTLLQKEVEVLLGLVNRIESFEDGSLEDD
ncbi:MAG: creatininase family protein [Deltaproteobacteria bacterium]|nr:creatininase family protein [Deltaproteobacteria bacterium]MBW2099104.1 creatininase family protein [Deltaproteobacteria bacterium]PXF55754.1 MAG: creatininase [Deltaproteobacteria bacterium]RKX58430.1 MAG: creatininase family protein [Thermodesulfobacteriota bacterium]RLB80605.1 MAG: creatininase family protein [Deltaproteobacteria bacterium]